MEDTGTETQQQGGFELTLELFGTRIVTLSELADLTGDLVETARRLGERLPMLGTAPPAVQMSRRLRSAAGESGLAGEVEAAEREVREFQHMLSKAKERYTENEAQAQDDMRVPDEERAG